MHRWVGSYDDHLFRYRFHCTSVYDGDTVRGDIDLGANVVLQDQSIRLYGIDTPEMRGAEKEAGRVARDYVRSLVLGKDIAIRTERDRSGKYGRLLGYLFVEVDGEIECVNRMLVERDMAVMALYGDEDSWAGWPSL